MALIFYLGGNRGMGNFSLFLALLLALNRFVLDRAIKSFQNNVLPAMMNTYEKVITWSLKGKHTFLLLFITVLMFIGSIVLIAVRKPQVVFFPSADPNFVYVYLRLPNGTDQAVTDSIAKVIEERVYSVIGEENPLVEAVITNVTLGTNDPTEADMSPKPNRARIGVSICWF